jgi:hypothetical protein
MAAINAGMHPFIVSYGFEDNLRLTDKFKVPGEVISKTPEEFVGRLSNALNLSVKEPILLNSAHKIISLPHSSQAFVGELKDIKGS